MTEEFIRESRSSAAVRYVAVDRGGRSASAAHFNRYDEILVNPTSPCGRTWEATPERGADRLEPDPEVLQGQETFASEHPWFTVHRVDAQSHFPPFEVSDKIAGLIEDFASKL